MENNSNINQNREAVFKELEKFLKTETVVGEPIVIGEITIVPLITVNFGYGMGEGGGGSKENVGEYGGGLGVGAKISPDALLVINKGEVNMMPIKNNMNFDKIIDKIPGILDKINMNKSEEEKKKEEGKQEY